MHKYPSINQYRHLICECVDRARYIGRDDHNKPMFDKTKLAGKITLNGTVKIHGINSGIFLDKNGNYGAQSREVILSETKDNKGFCKFALKNKDWFEPILKSLLGNNEQVIVYGEWFGMGIQSGVAVSHCEKTYAIFGIKVYQNAEDHIWINSDYKEFESPERNIYSVKTFGEYKVEIDLDNPKLAQNELIRLTEEVEKECPVGKYFGFSGIGEGIVYENPYDLSIKMKVKGSKHAVTKVKTLAPVDIEKLNSIAEFVDYSVTENRLLQGLQVMEEHGIIHCKENIKHYNKWIIDDIVKEESDTLTESNLVLRDVAANISKKAVAFYMSKIK